MINELKSTLVKYIEDLNSTESLKVRFEGWNRIIQIELTDYPSENLYIQIKDKAVSFKKGEIDRPHLALISRVETFSQILKGAISPLFEYMKGDLGISGPIQDAVQFFKIIRAYHELLRNRT